MVPRTIQIGSLRGDRSSTRAQHADPSRLTFGALTARAAVSSGDTSSHSHGTPMSGGPGAGGEYFTDTIARLIRQGDFERKILRLDD